MSLSNGDQLPNISRFKLKYRENRLKAPFVPRVADAVEQLIKKSGALARQSKKLVIKVGKSVKAWLSLEE